VGGAEFYCWIKDKELGAGRKEGKRRCVTPTARISGGSGYCGWRMR